MDYATQLSQAERIASAAAFYAERMRRSGGRPSTTAQYALHSLCRALVSHDLGNADETLEWLSRELGVDLDGDRVDELGYPLATASQSTEPPCPRVFGAVR